MSNDDDAFTFGRMLEHLRAVVRRLSQTELAEKMCAELNERNSKLANPPRPITRGAMRTAISLAEQNRRRLDGPKSESAASALRVPPIWFDNPALSWAKFLEDLNAWLQHQLAEAVPRRATRAAESPAQHPRFLHRTSSLPKSPDHAVFRHKGQAFHELNQAVFGTTAPAVFCLKGPLGIGKSTLLHNWCQRENQRLKERGVLAIHCVDKTGDDLREELIDYYSDCGIIDPSSSLVDLVVNYPLVLILDAIERFDRTDISGANLSPMLLLETILGTAFQRSANVKVVVTYAPEAVPGVSDAHQCLRGLAAGAQYREFELPGLQPDDAAEFLSKCGLNVPREMLRKISEEVEGNPTLLSAFIAGVLRNGGGLVAERVQHSSILARQAVARNSPTVRTEIFRDLIIRSHTHSPEAFTTLVILTACHDGLELDELQELVTRLLSNTEFLRACKLKRPKNGPNMDFLGGPLAGLIRTTPRLKKARIARGLAHGGRRPTVKSLHALARLEIAKLLTEFVAPIGRIIVHSELAEYLLGLVPAETDETYIPNTVDIERYHDILQHLTSMYDVAASAVGAQAPKRAAKNTKQGAGQNKRAVGEGFSKSAVLATPGRFLEGVFNDVMMLRLGNESRVIGRQLGHFERKLAMLGLFYQVEDLTGKSQLSVKDGLGQGSKRTLFYETAVVANYTGRLSIAHNAVREALRSFPRKELPTHDQIECAIRASLRKGENLEPLRLVTAELDSYSALLNVSATTYCREGNIDIAEKLLEHPFTVATGLAITVRALVGSERPTESTASNRVRGYFHRILVALRRVASKLGQVKTYKSDLAAAAEAFNTAIGLEQLRSGTVVLRGETGRAYCRFLLASQQEQGKGEVLKIIKNNIEHSRKLKRYYEVVEWHIELVCFECRHGTIEAAHAALGEIDELTKTQGIGLSFSAQKELEIERCRVDMRISDSLRVDRLKAGLQSCKLSRHELLACETQILLSQASQTVDDRVFWRREAEETMKRTGYLLPQALEALG